MCLYQSKINNFPCIRPPPEVRLVAPAFLLCELILSEVVACGFQLLKALLNEVTTRHKGEQLLHEGIDDLQLVTYITHGLQSTHRLQTTHRLYSVRALTIFSLSPDTTVTQVTHRPYTVSGHWQSSACHLTQQSHRLHTGHTQCQGTENLQLVTWHNTHAVDTGWRLHIGYTQAASYTQTVDTRHRLQKQAVDCIGYPQVTHRLQTGCR